MRSGWGQAVRASVAIEAGTARWKARLGGGQTQATVVAVMEAAGGNSVAAGGSFKTLQKGEKLWKDLVLFFPLPLKQTPWLR